MQGHLTSLLTKAAASSESLAFLFPSYFAHDGLGVGCALPHLPPSDRVGTSTEVDTGESQERGQGFKKQTFSGMQTQPAFLSQE